MKSAHRILACALAALLLALTGCAGAGAPAQGTQTGAATVTAQGKYDPPIELVSVKSVDATVKFLGDDTIYDNVWTRTYEEELGIRLTYLWVVDSAQRQQKLSATIMSGQMPDVFNCDGQMLKLLSDSGLIADLTDVYEEYASPTTREVLGQEELALPSGTLNGRLMGIPVVDSSLAGAHLLWLRRVWLDKLNIPDPQNMDDVREIARRFTQEDPDGNGAADTFGLALDKNLWSGYGGLTGFFNGYHAYPGLWYEQDGALVYGTVQPEMKAALQALQEMYAAGEITRDFGVIDGNKVAEQIANSRLGMTYGPWWTPYYPLYLSQANVPDAYWQAFPLPSADAAPAKSQYSVAVGSYFVVRKDYAHPEALMKLINFWNDTFLRLEDDALRNKYLGSLDNPDVVIYKYTDFLMWEPDALLRENDAILQALRSRNPAALSRDAFWRYQVIMAYFDQGIKEAWSEVATHGEGGAVSLLKEVAEGKGMLNRFYGAPTPVMGEKMVTLKTMQDEAFTKIIMGEDIAAFDRFVEDWYALGGEAIVAEVNDWWRAQ